MDSSPFNRSAKKCCSPPPTPQPPSRQDEEEIEIFSTTEIQNWMSSIELYLNEVCSTSCEGKLNTNQKLRISNLCRKIGHGTSQLAVQYQSLKLKALKGLTTIRALKDDINLSEQLQVLSHIVKELSKPAQHIATYADMIKNSGNNFVRPSNVSSVAIYPKDKLKTSEATKSLVQQIISPEEMKLQVRGLRKTKNGGIIMSSDSKGDIEKLKISVQMTTSDLTVDEPHKRKPRIIVIGIPTSMQEQEVFKCLYEQNLSGKLHDITREKFLSSIRLSHKSGKNNAPTCNYVIEVPALIRKILITKERVYVIWSSCPVRDFTLVTRCFKCQQYGHAAKSCRTEICICGHCGDQGHAANECPKKEESPKCATCLYFKKPSNHKTGDVECPVKKKAEQRYINSIDY